jgi:hypothetical protein
VHPRWMHALLQHRYPWPAAAAHAYGWTNDAKSACMRMRMHTRTSAQIRMFSMRRVGEGGLNAWLRMCAPTIGDDRIKQ